MVDSYVSGTVAEVLAWAADPSTTVEQLVEALEDEQTGRARVTLIEGLEAEIAARGSAEPASDAVASDTAVLSDAVVLPEDPGASRVAPSFAVSKACVIDGVAYARGASIPAATAATFRKLDVLVSNRTLVPTPDPHGRRTDLYGPGAAPRQHPTPTHYSPTEVGSW